MVNEVIEQFDRFGILPHTLPNAIGMWPNEQECLVWCALQSKPGNNWLEIGSFCGGSTLLLALAKQKHDPSTRVIAVDNNFNPMFDYNIKKSKLDNIVKIECSSRDIIDYYINYFHIVECLSFIFLDGWHSFASVLNEFELLQPLMSNDCIIGFHDVSPKMCYMDHAYIGRCYCMTKEERDRLMNDTSQNFILDEAIATICLEHGYGIIDIPVRTNETHFPETHLTEWVRGETSPFNSFTAIRKIQP